MTARLAGPLWLASASPRRRELLAQVGLGCEVRPSRADEERARGEAPEAFVRRAARDKAMEVWTREAAERAGAWVLGADTVVVRGAEVLGKPTDSAHAARMLRSLSGREHHVWTGAALVSPAGEISSLACRTELDFRALGDAEIERYVATREGLDKAGAYAAQGIAAGFCERIVGSFSNVVGLPLAETLDLMRTAGLLEAWP